MKIFFTVVAVCLLIVMLDLLVGVAHSLNAAEHGSRAALVAPPVVLIAGAPASQSHHRDRVGLAAFRETRRLTRRL